MTDLPVFDKTTFSNNPFLVKVEKPWGYELIFTLPDLPYTGKILHINAGKRLSLQVHDVKQESYYLFNGSCNLVVENSSGEVETIAMEPHKGYTIKIGQKHRHQAVTDCDIFEVSTPEIGTTYRLEDDYNRPDETQAVRADERKQLSETSAE